METLLKDIRYGVSFFVETYPGFSAIVIFTLAVGIGASTAIFTVVNSVMLRRLPYRTSDRIVAIQEINEEGKLAFRSPRPTFSTGERRIPSSNNWLLSSPPTPT